MYRILKVNIRPNNILRLLARMNKTQVWLAGELQTTKQYWHQVMKGTRTPAPKMRQKIADVFEGVDWDTLFIEVPKRRK